MAQEEISIRELLQLCLSTDAEEHWCEFVRRTRSLIASVIINTVRRWKQPAPALVDDLIQDTYVKLLSNDRKALRSIKNEYENTIFGYLKVVASNVVRDHFRQPPNKADEIELSEAALPPGPDEKERLEFLHKKEQVHEILETLSSSETYRRDVAIFWFFYEQGYTAKEISLLPAVGLTVKGVEAVLLRLARYCRQKLGMDGPEKDE
ncbi:MAG TPA: sigma-70 family RNA polymerase sigma factor [Candidatus Binatia bacterium]|nr:sigma-70 family RNA polymerase sigma factor [Candidatus Binatia bacterium]